MLYSPRTLSAPSGPWMMYPSAVLHTRTSGKRAPLSGMPVMILSKDVGMCPVTGTSCDAMEQRALWLCSSPTMDTGRF